MRFVSVGSWFQSPQLAFKNFGLQSIGDVHHHESIFLKGIEPLIQSALSIYAFLIWASRLAPKCFLNIFLQIAPNRPRPCGIDRSRRGEAIWQPLSQIAHILPPAQRGTCGAKKFSGFGEVRHSGENAWRTRSFLRNVYNTRVRFSSVAEHPLSKADTKKNSGFQSRHKKNPGLFRDSIPLAF